MRKYWPYIVASVVLAVAALMIWKQGMQPKPLDIVDDKVREAEAKRKSERVEEDKKVASHELVLKPDWATLDKEIEETKKLLEEVAAAPSSTDPEISKIQSGIKALYSEMLFNLEKRRGETPSSIVPLLKKRIEERSLRDISIRENSEGFITVSTAKIDGSAYRLLRALLTKACRLRFHACIGEESDTAFIETVKQSYLDIGKGDFLLHRGKVLPLEESSPMGTASPTDSELIVIRTPILDAPQILEANGGKNSEGTLCLKVQMAPLSGQIFQKATKLMINQRMAVVIDDKIYMTPQILGVMSDRFQISHKNFMREDVEFLVATLRHRPLPVNLLLVSDKTENSVPKQ